LDEFDLRPHVEVNGSASMPTLRTVLVAASLAAAAVGPELGQAAALQQPPSQPQQPQARPAPGRALIRSTSTSPDRVLSKQSLDGFVENMKIVLGPPVGAAPVLSPSPPRSNQGI
jgi:hypothetical protein